MMKFRRRQHASEINLLLIWHHQRMRLPINSPAEGEEEKSGLYS